MADGWAAELASAMQGLAGSGTGGQRLLFAHVNNPDPLSIKISGQVISRHLYRNAGYSPQAGDEVIVLRHGDAFYLLMRVVPA